MRIALLADIHANREALDACLAHARREGADRLVFLGDLVGYGADPEAVIDLVAAEAAQGAVVIKGNHDEAIALPEHAFNAQAAAAVRWTRARLGRAHAAYLAALPLTHSEPGALFVHASAVAPQRWSYVDSAARARASLAAAEGARVFCGHVHAPCLYVRRPDGRVVPLRPDPGREISMHGGASWLAVVGAVGQPRDGDPAAGYALLDLEHDRITFHRVPYDSALAASKVRAAGLPSVLAYRIERGL